MGHWKALPYNRAFEGTLGTKRPSRDVSVLIPKTTIKESTAAPSVTQIFDAVFIMYYM